MDDLLRPADGLPVRHPWRRIADVEVCVTMFDTDECLLEVQRTVTGGKVRTVHTTSADLDREAEFESVAEDDHDLAVTAAVAALAQFRLDIREVAESGLLDVSELMRLAEQARLTARRKADYAELAAMEHDAFSPSPLLDAARRLGLNPTPNGDGKVHWVARCPGANHTLTISTATETFGCGYCKRKGGISELEEFVESRRRRLS